MLRRHPNTPVHAFQDNAAYFITGAIYDKRPLLRDAALKQTLLDQLRLRFQEYGWALEHWVILDNHYHLLGHSRKGVDLREIMRRAHSASAITIHADTACDLPVWWNYWDYCPRNERDYYIRLNYLLYNPVKHGYVSDLKEYPYSSFHTLLQDFGRDRLARQFHDYPKFRRLDEVEDGF